MLERFQAAERALREGGQAAAAEASETASVGSATSTQALNPFVAVLLGYKPPLGPARGFSLPWDVPDTFVKVEPKAAAVPPGAPPATATLGPSDVQTEKEAGRASRNPAGAPPARRKKQNKQSSSSHSAGPDASSSSDSSSSPPRPLLRPRWCSVLPRPCRKSRQQSLRRSSWQSATSRTGRSAGSSLTRFGYRAASTNLYFPQKIFESS